MQIQVANLSKRYGPFWALRGATFSIRQGEILGLIGPNGSGKTSLFRSLAGVMPATLGEVRLDGQIIPPSERKRILYFMPDGIRPWQQQTADWALRFIAHIYRCADSSRSEVIELLALRPLLGS